ncbi:MAG: ATP-binding protein [Anaerolineales bacterium]|nr:ATP-binding protein [Anaerolineales bacterium]
MTDIEAFLIKLHQNLNILREREAKYVGDAPLTLLNQIEDHQTAIMLTEQLRRGELSETDWLEALHILNTSTISDPTIFLLKLHRHLNTLRERELKYVKWGGSPPVSLLNQIQDYQTAIQLTEKFLRRELKEVDWQQALQPLLLSIESRNNQIELLDPWVLFIATKNYNPYIAGPPITQPEMFFGRQADLEKVIGLLKNNFVMLTGPRRIGKTSLLHQLTYQLSILMGIEKFIPVLVNIEGALETEFFHLLMEEIVSAVQPFLPPETTTTLSFDLSNFVYPARAFSRDLQAILKGLQTTTPLPSRLVLLLDEMDTLNSYSLETQSQLRRIFQRFTNTNLSIVVAGVKLRQQWAGESSPFYNMFIPVTLSPFPETEARRLITGPVQGRYTYQDEAITRILQATSGLPHRIQQLCLEVINRISTTSEGRQEITVEDVDSILPAIQWLDEPTLSQDQVTTIVTTQPAIAEDRTEYDPTTSTSTDQETK